MTSAASGLGAAALASLLAEDDLLGTTASPGARHAPRADACILIFLQGGASHIDMFDPKPGIADHAGELMPDSMIGDLKFNTALDLSECGLRPTFRRFEKHGRCGMDFSDLVPHIAGEADEWCMVRSMHSHAFNHLPAQLFMNTGYDRAGFPAAGAWVMYGLGSTSRNLPGYVVLSTPEAIRGGLSNWTNAFLPAKHQGVMFRNQGDAVPYLANPPGVTPAIQRQTVDTLNALTSLDRSRVPREQLDSRIAQYELAFAMQTAAPELMDIGAESEATRRMYGVGRDTSAILKKDKARNVAESFATNCLLARRLVERGVRFVSLFHNGWDHHGQIEDKLVENSYQIDRPVAALVADLRQRGLLDRTLVILATEFGRTAVTQFNNNYKDPNGGRDHHPYAYTVLMAGGGTRPGHIVGGTDEFGWRVADNPVHVHDYHATVLHLLGLDHERLTYKHQGREFRLTDVGGYVVREILA